MNTRVVTISFSSAMGARAWLEETGAACPLLLDPERTAYRAYGLGHSLLRSWQPKVLVRYAQLLLSGREWRGIQGDSAQLGGDFIIDANGIIRYAYRSQDPTDRPTADELLSVIAQHSP